MSCVEQQICSSLRKDSCHNGLTFCRRNRNGLPDSVLALKTDANAAEFAVCAGGAGFSSPDTFFFFFFYLCGLKPSCKSDLELFINFASVQKHARTRKEAVSADYVAGQVSYLVPSLLLS